MLTVLAFILGLAGAAYSFLSKMMADKVFDRTVEIQESITSFFGGYDVITDEKDEKGALQMIAGARRSLVIYTGCMLATFYRNPRAGIEFASKLTAKITEKSARQDRFEVKMMCDSDETERLYLRRFEEVNKSTPIQGRSAQEWRTQYVAQKDALVAAIRGMPAGTWDIGWHGKDSKPQVRFIIKDNEKALFWILEDATPESAATEAHRSRVRAAGFSTDTWQMIDILTGLFENALRSNRGEFDPGPSPGTAS